MVKPPTNSKIDVQELVATPHQSLWHWLRASDPRNVAAAPFIYLMSLPFVLLDLCLSGYQWVCFPLFRIPRVARSHYLVFDRHRLSYLNTIEKVHCLYCSYINGLVAYAAEIVARTEQYWCPLKHATKTMGAHRYYDEFADYGVDVDYAAYLERMREAARHPQDRS